MHTMTALESVTLSASPLRAVERLRGRYGDRPVWGRRGLYVLSHEDAHHALQLPPTDPPLDPPRSDSPRFGSRPAGDPRSDSPRAEGRSAGDPRSEGPSMDGLRSGGLRPDGSPAGSLDLAGLSIGGGVITGKYLCGVVGPEVVRTLALLAWNAHACATAVKELATGGPTPFVRACLVESLRLWPRTPFLTRTTDAALDLHGVRLPPGTTLVIPVPLIGPAREFAPWRWIGTSAPPDLCPEHTLTAGQAALSTLLPERGYELLDRDLDPLPTRLDATRLRFAVHPVGPAVPRPTRPAVPRQRAQKATTEPRLSTGT